MSSRTAAIPPDRAEPMALSATQLRIIEAARTGRSCDLWVDDRVPGRHDKQRNVDPAWLGDLLTGKVPGVALHSRGFVLEHARLVGLVDWSGLQLQVPVALRDCVVGPRGRVLLDHATGVGIELTRCHLSGFSAHRLRLTHDLLLAAEVDGEVRLTGASIGGALVLSGAVVRGPGGRSVTAEGIEVAGDVLLNAGFTATGGVRLAGATIGGSLDCSSGTFDNPLTVEEPGPEEVAGEAFNATTAAGLSEAPILQQVREIRQGRRQIVPVAVTPSCKAYGRSFQDVPENWGDDVPMQHPGEEFDALNCSGAHIARDVVLVSDFAATGAVRFLGADVGGQVKCSGAKFWGTGGYAFIGDSLTVDGSVVMTEGMSAHGQVRLVGATIGGQLDCSGATLENPHGDALVGDLLEVRGNVLLRQGFRADGTIRLEQATIGGLDCGAASMFSGFQNAVLCDRAEIKGDVFLDHGYEAHAPVRFSSAHIHGDFDCWGGSFSPAGVGFDGSGMSVDGRFIGCPQSEGTVDLSSARTGILDDRLGERPPRGPVLLSGFRYERIDEHGDCREDQRLAWIRSQPHYSGQPYQQLAAVYRNSGRDREARVLLVAQRRDARRRGDMSRLARAWNVFLDVTTGFGYRTWRVAFVLPILYALSVLLVALAAGSDAMLAVRAAPGSDVQAAQCTNSYPCLSAWSYPVDFVVPILNLHQAEYWQPDASTGWGHLVRNWLYVATVLGWAATTLLVAAFTALPRRE